MAMRSCLSASLLALASAAYPQPDLGESVGPKDYGVEHGAPPAAFRFSSAYSSDMVLQQAPASAVVWGFAPAGAKVSVSFGGKSIDAPVSTYMGQSTFMAKLPPTPSSMTTTHNISAIMGGNTITLGNVLFGKPPPLPRAHFFFFFAPALRRAEL